MPSYVYSFLTGPPSYVYSFTMGAPSSFVLHRLGGKTSWKRSFWRKSVPCWLARGREWSFSHICILVVEILLADGDCMTALLHCKRQRWQKINFFAKKNHIGLCFNTFTRCACPVSLTCRHVCIQQVTCNSRPCDVVCLKLKHFRIR